MDSPRQRIGITTESIVALKVEAIVNAANTSLLGGGGVDGAIHRAAGPRLQEECRSVGGCATGEVKLTRGHRLPARYILHAVGPVYHGGQGDEAKLLRSCYEHALLIAARKRMASVAFPAISCGAYGYPIPEAADIAVTTVLGFLAKNPFPQKILFCCREDEVREAYERRIEKADLERGAQ